MTLCVLPLVFGIAHATEISPNLLPHRIDCNAEGKGITKAWYGCPTERYRHGVLGDGIEGGCLKVKTSGNQTITLNLPDHQVFEDVTPRIADIDGDGLNDVISIRSDLKLGAALVVYALPQTETQISTSLVELAATPPHRLSHRWLAPAGIADFNNDGVVDIAYVQTPHIGGTLRIWSMLEGQFTEIGRLGGFSNHSIGSSRVTTKSCA